MFMFLVSHPSYTSIGSSPCQDLPESKVIFSQFLLTRWGETWTVDELSCPWIVASIWVLSSANSACCSSIGALACSRSISGSEWCLSPHLAMLAYLSSPPGFLVYAPPSRILQALILGELDYEIMLSTSGPLHLSHGRPPYCENLKANIWPKLLRVFGAPKRYVSEKLLHKYPHLLVWGYRLALTELSHNPERHIRLDTLKPHKIRNRWREMYITSFEGSGDQWYTCLLSVYLSS